MYNIEYKYVYVYITQPWASGGEGLTQTPLPRAP